MNRCPPIHSSFFAVRTMSRVSRWCSILGLSSFQQWPKQSVRALPERTTQLAASRAGVEREVRQGRRGRQDQLGRKECRERLGRTALRGLAANAGRSGISHRRRCKNSWICVISWMVPLRNFNCSFNASRRSRYSSTRFSPAQRIPRSLVPRSRKLTAHPRAGPRHRTVLPWSVR